MQLIWTLIVALLLAGPSWAGTPNPKAPAGINLDGVRYYSTGIPFANLMKESDYYLGGGTGATYDSNGWLTSMPSGTSQVQILIMRDKLGTHCPSGDYHLSWSGDETGMSTTGMTSVDTTNNTAIIHKDHGDACNITLTFTSIASDHIRNIRLTIPGGICGTDYFTRVNDSTECGQPGTFRSFASDSTITFNPDFVARLKEFGVIRFMDWNETNSIYQNSVTCGGSTCANTAAVRAAYGLGTLTINDLTWDDRTVATYRSFGIAPGHDGPQGVPYEYQISLANLMHTDLWVTVPLNADSDYVDSLATLINTNLDPALQVYVEHSNEVWNPGFPQYTINLSQATAIGLNPNIQHAIRTREIGNAFKAVLGSDRVITTLAYQGANPFTATVGMDYLEGLYGVDNTGIDALAMGSYWGLDVFSDTDTNPNHSGFLFSDWSGASEQDVLDQTDTQWPLSVARGTSAAPIAAQYGISLVCYECGLELLYVPGGSDADAVNTLLTNVADNAGFHDQYVNWLNGLKDAGVVLINHYSHIGIWGTSGRWALMHYIDDTRATAPRYDAVLDFIEGVTPPPGGGGNPPGTETGKGTTFQGVTIHKGVSIH